MAWNPSVYNKFKEERYAPFYDLQSLIKIKPDLTVIDLGCGTGELTGKLANQLPNADVLGIDSSAEMLEASHAYVAKNVHFQQTDIASKIQEAEKYDLVFSNAALQWLDDHENLFASIIKLLKPGGQLAVQVPSNHDHFTHTTLRELAATEPYQTALGGWSRLSSVLTIDKYSQLLFDNGCKEITVFEKVYPHVLKDAAAIYDWISGTAILRYLEKLPENVRESFTTAYKNKLQAQYPGSPVFYPFKRILLSGVF